MEEYKLTKEEREMIKKIGLFRLRAKKSVENYKIPDTLLAHLYDNEFTKLEKTGVIKGDSIESIYRTDLKIYDGRVRKLLEDDLEICKKIQSKDIISIITEDKPTDRFKYKGLDTKLKAYIEKKVGPFLKDYIPMLEKAIEIALQEENDAKQIELMLTGKISYADYEPAKGRTRSKELTEEDKQQPKMSKEEIEAYREKFNKELSEMMKEHEEEMTKEETGLELPVAEGLKEPTKEVTEEKKTEPEEEPVKKKITPQSYMPFRKISSETLIALVDHYLMQDGIAEPGMLKKGYAKCTNKDTQNFTETIEYDTQKKLDMVPCSEENSRKLFEKIKPRYTLSIDMFYGDAVLKDTKTGKSKILDLKLKNFGKS